MCVQAKNGRVDTFCGVDIQTLYHYWLRLGQDFRKGKQNRLALIQFRTLGCKQKSMMLYVLDYSHQSTRSLRGMIGTKS
jgi:hypothetical protein